MLLEIVKYPHSALRTKCTPVSTERLNSPEFKAMVSDMVETSTHHKAAGLAANQVGFTDAVLLALNPETSTYVVCVNPVIEEFHGPKQPATEGCLSFPMVEGTVLRHQRVTATWVDTDGVFHRDRPDAFRSHIIQHEGDHLNGKIMIDHMPKEYRGRFLERYYKANPRQKMAYR